MVYVGFLFYLVEWLEIFWYWFNVISVKIKWSSKVIEFDVVNIGIFESIKVIWLDIFLMVVG